MDPEKLERIQLPVPSEAEKTTYNHLLAERLIRIMNNAAQPGTGGVLTLQGWWSSQGPAPHMGHQEPWALVLTIRGSRKISATLSATHTRVLGHPYPPALPRLPLQSPLFPARRSVRARPCPSSPSVPNPSFASFAQCMWCSSRGAGLGQVLLIRCAQCPALSA